MSLSTRLARALLGGAMLFAAHANVSAAVVQIADYRSDFTAGAVVGQSASFANGWQYQWNAPADWTGTSSANATTGPITSFADYELLRWSGSNWTADADTNSANGAPANFLQLTSVGGHPGRGSTQPETNGNNLDRYPIASYTVQTGEDGRAFLSLGAGKNQSAGTNIDLLVFKNNNPVPIVDIQNFRNVGRTIDLGGLVAGDTIHVALGPDTSDGSDSFQWDINLSTVSANTNFIADYQNEYTGLTKVGDQSVQAANAGTPWRFQWNGNGAIGNAASYVDLLATGNAAGSTFDVNGTNGALAADPGAFASITPVSGHPGRGSTQTGNGNTLDRYILASYIVPAGGEYSFIGASGTFINSNGTDIEVWINNTLAINQANVFASAFSGNLGFLPAGTVIRFAVGPNGTDGSDGTGFDFTILGVIIPEPSSAMLGLLSLAGLGLRRRRNA